MKVAIAGYGIEGKANYAYWYGLGDDVTILDQNGEVQGLPEDAEHILGSQAFGDLDGFDMVVRTASLAPNRLPTAKKIWSATNEFFDKCPASIIGVTGTKGKGTTSSLIAAMLREAGKTVHLVGNIGVAALEVLPIIQPDDVVVFEMSSFQLWDLEKSPHTSVVLMVEPDHMDVHKDMDEYVMAKSGIRRHQVVGGMCFYHPTNQYSKQIAEASSISQPRRYGVPDDGACYVKENTFFIQNDPICSVDTLQLVGEHNVENACAAISAVWEYTRNIEAIEGGLKAFHGLPHRTKLIREVDGVRYYDDNYSSAPGAAIAAMRSFAEPEVLIMGGYDKHISFEALAEAIAEQSNIKRIILIGQTKQKIAEVLDAVGKNDIYELSDETSLGPIVKRAHEVAEPGDVVVMSPACASFDMFKNFSDRGDQFIRIVEGL